MPRTHRRRLGARNYRPYSEPELKECIQKIKSGQLSQRKAAEEYKIPRSTLKNKLKNKHTKKVGRPPALKMQDENRILSWVQQLCDYGFPATDEDVRHYIKRYLDTKNRTVVQFKKNLPGHDYMHKFHQRHKDFTARLIANKEYARVSVSEQSIKKYHENLTKQLNRVPASNIWNYAELCLVNNPGAEKCILKRGTRYPEKITNHTTNGVSIMFCCNAEGEILPPYCVYNSSNVRMNTRDRKSLPRTKFHRSESGWFDEGTFKKFFDDILLPRLKKQDGTKVMIGDNLSSHFSSDVIEKCGKNKIKFICLPPNSTDRTQPLDVSYFKLLTVAWRKILNRFRKTKVGQKETSIRKETKDVFPQLLHELVTDLKKGNGKNYLKAGFKKSGIHPLDVTPILRKLEQFSTGKVEDFDTSLMKNSQELRAADETKPVKKARHCKVIAEQSIQSKHFDEMEEEQPQKKRRK